MRQFLERNPGATAAAAARALGVSRQRIAQIADEEGIDLSKYTTQYPGHQEFVGTPHPVVSSHISPSLDELTGHGTSQHVQAVLMVTQDLIERGFDVYTPVHRRQDGPDLISYDPDTHETKPVIVDTTTMRRLTQDPNADINNIARFATVTQGAIMYVPAFGRVKAEPKGKRVPPP